MASGVLEVVLVEAEGIKEETRFGCCNCFFPVTKPYVCVQYGNEERLSRVAKGMGKKLLWNQKFSFRVEYQGEDSHGYYDRLVFRVMDEHMLSDHDLIGETRVHVRDVVQLGMENGSGELPSQKYRVVRPDKSYTGNLSFAVTFKRKDGTEGGSGP